MEKQSEGQNMVAILTQPSKPTPFDPHAKPTRTHAGAPGHHGGAVAMAIQKLQQGLGKPKDPRGGGSSRLHSNTYFLDEQFTCQSNVGRSITVHARCAIISMRARKQNMTQKLHGGTLQRIQVRNPERVQKNRYMRKRSKHFSVKCVRGGC